MYIPNGFRQNYPFCRLHLGVETFGHSTLSTNCEANEYENFIIIFGTSVINSPMSPPSLYFSPFIFELSVKWHFSYNYMLQKQILAKYFILQVEQPYIIMDVEYTWILWQGGKCHQFRLLTSTSFIGQFMYPVGGTIGGWGSLF